VRRYGGILPQQDEVIRHVLGGPARKGHVQNGSEVRA
jgi:hypothetical protein